MPDENTGMRFGDYKDRILCALGALLIAWMAYLTHGYVSLPHIHSDGEITTIANERSQYAHDKQLINDRFERLWEERQKIDVTQDRLVQELSNLRIQVERLITALTEQQKWMGQRDRAEREENP